MKNRKRRSAAVLAAGMSVLLGAGTIAGATEQTDADNSIRKEELFMLIQRQTGQ